MQKRLIFQFRGIEGAGNTRLGLNLLDLYRSQGIDAYLIANTSRKWPRETTQDTSNMLKIAFHQEDYFDEILNGVDLKKGDTLTLDIISVPPKVVTKNEKERKRQEGAIENVFSTLERLRGEFDTYVNYMQCDHSIMSISRNIYRSRPEFWNYVDRIISFSHQNDFNLKYISRNSDLGEKFVGDRNVATYLTPYEFKFETILPFEEKIPHTFHFLGRSALWKGPIVWRNTFHENFEKDGYASVIEGYESSISGKTYISLDNDIKKGVDPRCTFYKRSIKPNNNSYYKFGQPIEVWGQFTQSEGFARMQKAMFGIFFSYLERSGNGPLEYTLFETIDNGTVPIIRTDLYHYATLPNGEKMDNYSGEELGLILYDLEDPTEGIKKIKELENDKEKYNSYRKNAQIFWKKNIEEYMESFKDILNSRP